MKTDMPIKDFWKVLKKNLIASFDMKEYSLSAADEAEVEKLKDQVYSRWSWNYGASPPHNVRKVRRIEGCGKIEILLDIGKEGKVNNMAFYGDFFEKSDTAQLAAMLVGQKLRYDALKNALEGTDISHYFNNLDTESFLSLLLE